jgi:hypothetical protein
MTKIIDWRQKILAELPTEEDLFVEKYLMDAIQELCKRTGCFTEAIVDVSTVDVADHTLVPLTANSKLVRFLYGKYKNDILDNKTIGEMKHEAGKAWEVIEGTPLFIVYEGGNTIRWSKIPDTTGDAVEFTVSLMPMDIEDSDIPSQIEDLHLETVKDYVKWKFYLQPATFQEKLAAYHEKRFEKGRGNLRISVLTGFSGNSQVQQNRFM